jgi:hypothetical protein
MVENIIQQKFDEIDHIAKAFSELHHDERGTQQAVLHSGSIVAKLITVCRQQQVLIEEQEKRIHYLELLAKGMEEGSARILSKTKDIQPLNAEEWE